MSDYVGVVAWALRNSVSPSLVRRWIRAGRLKAKKIELASGHWEYLIRADAARPEDGRRRGAK